jgi:hypothetical protein
MSGQRRRPTDGGWRAVPAGPGRHAEAGRYQLARAFGAGWLGQVEQLAAPFRRVAIAAGLARLDGWAEGAWLEATGTVASHQTVAAPLPGAPHADAPSLLAQALLLLRERGLWPWLLTPQAPER